MKVLVVCVLVGVSWAAPQSREPQAFVAPQQAESFISYLRGLSKVFIAAENQRRLQALFGEPSAREWLSGLLDREPPVAFPAASNISWGNGAISSQEWMAWYPSLVSLWASMGARPAVAEQWAEADINDDKEITPLELWPMLRDTAKDGSPFFSSAMGLLISRAIKDRAGPAFWSEGKRKELESQPFMKALIGFQPASDDEVMSMIKAVAEEQGMSEAANMMGVFGMGKEEGAAVPEIIQAAKEAPAITVETEDGQGLAKIPVMEAKTDGDEMQTPFIAPATPMRTTQGTMMPAVKVAMKADGLEAMPGAEVPVTMPGEKTIMMKVAGDQLPATPKPLAKITTAKGDIMMPITKMEISKTGVPCTTVLTTQGKRLEIEPESGVSGEGLEKDLNAQIPVIITDVSTKTQTTATGSAKEESDELVCGPELMAKGCVALEVKTGSSPADPKMTIPVSSSNGFSSAPESGKGLIVNDEFSDPSAQAGLAPPKNSSITLTDEASGHSVDFDVTSVAPVDAKTIVSAESAQTSMNMELEIPADGTTQGMMILSDSVTKQVQAETPIEVTAIETKEDGTVGSITAEGSLNGNPMKVQISDGQADSLPDGVEVSVNGAEPVKAPITEQTAETSKAVLPDGSTLVVPNAPEATPEGDDTVEGFEGAASENVSITSPNGETLTLPIIDVKPGPNITAITPQGSIMNIAMTKL